MSFAEKLEKIRSSPKLNNQQQTAVVLSAVEETLRNQSNELSSTAYFAALLSLLSQYISGTEGIVNKDVASSVVYLLDLVTPTVPTLLLQSKFSQILNSLAPALTNPAAEAPLLRSSIGCLESLLIAQKWEEWALPISQISPRRGMAGLLALANDHRPKVRRRAQDAVTKVLRHPPPSPSLDHPAADLCAETALKQAKDVLELATKNKKYHYWQIHEPNLVHALQLVKTVASASNGWPANKLNALCELMLGMSKKGNNYVIMTIYNVFEAIFQGMSSETSQTKLLRTLEILSEMQPSQDDAQLAASWIAVIAKGWDSFCHLSPGEAFKRLPDQFKTISYFLNSQSYDTRISATDCLLALLANGVPKTAILNPSACDWQILDEIANHGRSLLSIQYQSAWLEVFAIIGAMIDALWWHSSLYLSSCVVTVGDLRTEETFSGKDEANLVISKAIRAMGPDTVLELLPLNLISQESDKVGRAWLLPLLRDSVSNAKIAHFKAELVPIAEKMYEKLCEHGEVAKTMETKIYETVVQQIWAILPGYCDLPLDLVEAFDHSFAEMLSNLLYKFPMLRLDICKALEMLITTNQELCERSDNDELIRFARLTKIDAHKNLNYLSSLSNNILAVLFNVYSESATMTKPAVLNCISAYLSINPLPELSANFRRVRDMFLSSLRDDKVFEEPDAISGKEHKNPMSNNLLDLIVIMATHLPREDLVAILDLLACLLNECSSITLQKKAYKLLIRIPESEAGARLLMERSKGISDMLMSSAQKVVAPARRDRLVAFQKLIENMDQSMLYIIPSLIPEVVMSTRENNERARSAAFDLLVIMGEKMAQGGIVTNSASTSAMSMAEDVSASLEEYFKMVIAGLASPNQQLVSASITALARIMYQFKQSLTDAMIDDLVQTIDIFLTSTNREIVRSALGFIKVAVTCLPISVMLGRLHSVVPNLLIWSQEHKARFRSKVKHIFERMIRRFGVEIVERYCPESDKKLVMNIRKACERRKRKNQGEESQINGILSETVRERRDFFQSEFDEAIYGSDSDTEPDKNFVDDIAKKLATNEKSSRIYIKEDEDDPLDLLDQKALGKISTARPNRTGDKPYKRARPKTDPDGKFYLGIESDEEADVMEFGSNGQLKEDSDKYGSNLYLAARGEGIVRRGHKGLPKFSNRRSRKVVDADVVPDDDDSYSKGKQEKATLKGRYKGTQRKVGNRSVRGGRVVKTMKRHSGRLGCA